MSRNRFAAAAVLGGAVVAVVCSCDGDSRAPSPDAAVAGADSGPSGVTGRGGASPGKDAGPRRGAGGGTGPGSGGAVSDARMGTPDAPATGPDAAAPDATIPLDATGITVTFPRAGGLTDADGIYVRGTLAASLGGASVMVDSVPADVVPGDGGVVRWVSRTRVPLVPGMNHVTVSADLAGGGRRGLTLPIAREPILDGLERIVWDERGGRWLAITGNLVSIDTKGMATLIADGAPTSGRSLAYDAARGLAYSSQETWVTPGGGPTYAITSVQVVDVATGDASPLQVPADAGLGLGIPGSLIAIELDSANGRLIAADEADASVAAVDVATGEKTLISGASRGTGPAFMSPSDVALIDAGRIAVADEGVHSIFLVDAATGDRTYLQSFGYDEPKKIAFDAVHHRLAVYDASRPGVYLVNLDDPSDYTFEDQVDSVASLAFDSAGTTLLAGRSGASEPVRVVLSPSAPKGPFMPNQRVGEGDPLEYVTAMACLDDVHVLVAQDDTHANYRTELMNVDTSGGAVFAQPTTTDAIAAFAPDGARVLACTFDRSWFLAPDTFATTLAHGNPATSLGTWATQGCAADSTAGTAYFAVTTTAGPPYASAITAVDATGFFRTISDATRGTGPALQWLVGLDRDPVSGLLYAADRDSDLVLAIDPATGNRTVLEMRQGSEDHSYSMAYDAARRRVLVSGYSTISAVDASTGARSLVSASDAWNLHGVGPGLAGTGDPIAVSPDGSIVYRTNLAMAALIAIDAESGDRIIVRR